MLFRPRLVLELAALTCLALPGTVLGSLTQFCVNSLGILGCYSKIQDAINATPAGKDGSVITVAQATYQETLTIPAKRNVTINGAGPGSTIIDGTNGNTLSTISIGRTTVVALSGMTIRNGSGCPGSNILDAFGTSLKIENCEITNGTINSADCEGAGIASLARKLVVDSSTISNNQTQGGGGGIIATGQVFITNSTISNNIAAEAAGIAIGFGVLHLNNVTIANNSAAIGGGVYVGKKGHVSMTNSVIGDNSSSIMDASRNSPDCFGTLVSRGFNLVSNLTHCHVVGDRKTTILGSDPNLGSLTKTCQKGTQQPGTSSPLRNAGNPGPLTGKPGSAIGNCLPVDECGNSRAEGNCTIGAIQ